jgi:hypothetical protein
MIEDKLKRAKEQGQAQYDSICEMVGRLEVDEESARLAIHEDPLSVQVRSDWYLPGKNPGKPDEFEILLCTGGPAVRLIGTLDKWCQPETVRMQVQDWFEPWTTIDPCTEDDEREDVLLSYARCFWFGD